MTQPAGGHGPVGRWLDRLCRACAVAGAGQLGGIALLVVASVTGRACCDAPVQGDYELVQVAVAAAISLCLPWCQLRRGHIAVDFFTTRLPPRLQMRLDAAGALALTLVFALLAWRAAAGAADLHVAGETTMIVGFPVWIGYAATLPGLAFAAVAALHVAVQDWRQSYRWH